MDTKEREPVDGEEVVEAVGVTAAFPPPRAVTELLVIDTAPHRAHALWSIVPEDFEAARARAGSEHPPLVIRTHDVTGLAEFNGRNPHDTFDTVVEGLSGRRDIAVWRGERTYLAELGLRRPDGHLVLFARSDRFAMPKAARPQPAAEPVEMPEPEVVGLETQEAAGVLPPPLQAGPWPEAAELLSWSRSTLAPKLPAADAGPVPADGANAPPPAPLVLAVSGLPLVETPHIDAEHRKMVDEAGRIPPPQEHERIAYGRPVAPGEEDRRDDAEPVPAVALETLFRSTSSSTGRAEVSPDCAAELVLTGRIPAGRAATLFGRPVAVDAEGRFTVRLRLEHPGSVLDQVRPDALL